MVAAKAAADHSIHGLPMLCLIMRIHIRYQSRIILLSLVQDDPDFIAGPLPRVMVTQLNDYKVTMELQVWLDNEREHVKKSHELREKVFKALTAAGVEMPFETIQLAPHRVTIGMTEEKYIAPIPAGRPD